MAQLNSDSYWRKYVIPKRNLMYLKLVLSQALLFIRVPSQKLAQQLNHGRGFGYLVTGLVFETSSIIRLL